MVIRKINEKLGKKGQVQDLLTFIVSLFVIAIFLGIFFKMGFALKASLTASPLYDNTTADAINTLDKTAMIGDTAFGFIFMGLLLLLIITSVLTPVSVIYTTIYLIVGAVLWFMSIPLSNAYEAFATSSGMSGLAGDMPLTYLIMTKLPIITTLVLITLLIITFGKRYLFSEESLGGI